MPGGGQRGHRAAPRQRLPAARPAAQPRSRRNGGDGLFVCWRVKHGLFEQNELCGNALSGISIGHKDTDNVFRGNTSSGNGAFGLLFRNEDEPMGAHRNLFEDNRFLDNGVSGRGAEARAAIAIHGYHRDLVFRRNTIGNSIPARRRRSASSPAGTPTA